MAAPVWILSVDLQTKSATFTTGLADAAKSARGSFNEIKSGAGEMSGAVSYSTMEARHSVMMLGEEFGVHLPRSLTTFISGLGPIGPALEAAFPFLAVILGATLLIEHLAKLHEAGEKLTDDQMKFGTAAQNAFNALDQKIIEAEKRSDELKDDHLGALKLELELIDKQSMAELAHSFDLVARGADVVFAELKKSWYDFGSGSEGAKHALSSFQAQYESLLAKGSDKEASDLLHGTLDSAKKVLAAQQAIATERDKFTSGKTKDDSGYEAALAANRVEIEKAKVGYSKEDLAIQQAVVSALNDQVIIEAKVAELKKDQGSNAVKTVSNRSDADAQAAAREKAAEAERERKERQRALEEAYRTDLAIVQEGERAAIADAKEGSQARLNVIDAALQEERDHLAENTGEYRSLLTERANLVRQMAEEEAKARAEAAREEAEAGEKDGLQAVAALKRQIALEDSARRTTTAERIAQETNIADQEYAIKMVANAKEIAALDKDGKDYNNKLKQLEEQKKQIIQQNENDIAAIKDRVTEESNARILAASTRFDDSIASGLTSVLMRHETFAKMVTSLGDQVVSGMIQNALKMILTNDMTKASDAAKAARSAYNWGDPIGGPILGAVLGAAAFTAVMAFEEGGIVPGVGRGDIVPAMLTPGEGVVPGGVMAGLSDLARNGGLSGGGGTHYHIASPHFSPTIHALDADGVDAVLDKHADKFHAQFERTLRKLGR